jgi:hypothetical protein
LFEDDERELIFEPGVRGSAAKAARLTPGAGLGFRSHGALHGATGDLAAEVNGTTGTRFVVSLRAA